MRVENDEYKRFSVYNIVQSYKKLFTEAIKEKGNLEPYLQQLSYYDAREIEEFEAALSLSEDIAIRTLKSDMMKEKLEKNIKKKIKIFLTPEFTKTHGRPIYKADAQKCGLKIESKGVKDQFWKLLYELYIRTNNYVQTRAAKCIESEDSSSFVLVRRPRDENQ